MKPARGQQRSGAENANGNRSALSAAILARLTDELNRCNPFIGIYRTAREQLIEAARSQTPIDVILSPDLRIILQEKADPRTYNLPTRTEVAAFIPDAPPDFGQRTYRDMVLTLRAPDTGRAALRRVDPSHAAYLPLHYVLLFPHGDTGWSWGLRLTFRDQDNATQDEVDDLGHDDGDVDPPGVLHNILDIDPDPEDDLAASFSNCITARQYHAFRVFTRPDDFNPIHHACRLGHQYWVDAYATIEQSRLRWFSGHQDDIRADTYQGLADHLAEAVADTATEGTEAMITAPVGQRVILPSSHIGSPRFMKKICQDAIALIRKLGPPTLFITMTANPTWDEITRELFPGQTAMDRPDLVSRVFDLKKKDLLLQLCRKGIFGPSTGRFWTIEYQKRSLPHCHLLLFLENSDQFHNPSMIDEVVCAELPDPVVDPELSKIVRDYMVHMCGEGLQAPCTSSDTATGERTCSKRFPKPLTSETIPNEHGYPQYRRRDIPDMAFTKHVKGREVTVDNSRVVPYNPYLTIRYNCHINVELCRGVEVVKYITKYAYKGPDRATVRLTLTDEITEYLEGRYIGPSEAIWRLLGYRVHEEFPPVQALPVHLPGQQPVRFPTGAEVDDIRRRMDNTRSPLMAYFDYNTVARREGRPTYLYQDMLRHCVWDRSQRAWQPRKNGTVIGRMYHVNPRDGERFYLRLLLTVRHNAVSFEDLRTVRLGSPERTFRNACKKLGLLEDDNHWRATFTEAVTFASGKSLRNEFCVAVVHGDVMDPPALWDEFQVHLCDDLPRQLESYTEAGRELPATSIREQYLDFGLFLIGRLLAAQSKTLADYYMPSPEADWSAFQQSSRDGLHNMPLDRLATTAAELRDQLNDNQQTIFSAVVSTVLGGRPAAWYLQGPAGTGKTFLYRTIYAELRRLGFDVACVASSGIAATLLPDGSTAHSHFGIPLELHEDSTSTLRPRSAKFQRLRTTALIIWDEVPMQDRYAVELVDRLLKDARDDDRLFGGLPVLMGGDFAQTLPIVVPSSRTRTVAACLQRSSIWPQLTVLQLHRNMRLPPTGDNTGYGQYLSTMSYREDLQGTIILPQYIPRSDTVEELCDAIYPTAALSAATENLEFFAERSIVTIRNDAVAVFNDRLISRMTGDLRTYWSADRAQDRPGRYQPTLTEQPLEYLNSINMPGLPPSKLALRVGAPIMLIRNLRQEDGLCNGTRLIITGIYHWNITARIIAGDRKGVEHTIPRIPLETTDGQLSFTLRRVQFPIRLCFAMTINKSQGQSLKQVGVDLRVPAFSHGQLYVALSRVTDVAKLSILHAEGSDTTENIVFREVLQRFSPIALAVEVS
ncbi:hypothetical protein N7533_008297 [Penicillium manginii]|uniref:uncharacterized protein n=1 Tax=Penicillium manginii TaxID=203109 RepID=UPI0025469EFA|nr:uncharacterized protein N7533_008297 [Penicillium manginii]KAJ5751269.1 hypothetical protein N7533_008297 [Penicillium manginii]